MTSSCRRRDAGTFPTTPTWMTCLPSFSPTPTEITLGSRNKFRSNFCLTDSMVMGARLPQAWRSKRVPYWTSAVKALVADSRTRTDNAGYTGEDEIDLRRIAILVGG